MMLIYQKKKGTIFAIKINLCNKQKEVNEITDIQVQNKRF